MCKIYNSYDHYWNQIKYTEFSEYLITYDIKLKDDLNTKMRGGGKSAIIQSNRGKKPNYFVVKNFEFGGVDYCCILHTILTNYTEAINFVDLNNWILVMKRIWFFSRK